MRNILFLTTAGRHFCRMAVELFREYHADARVMELERDPTRKYAGAFDDVGDGPFDLIVSFLCPAILPRRLLEKSRLSVNFHPGSSEYPGTGCYNFALYEGAKEFGGVCHHMEPKVDTGAIIYESRFPIVPGDTVERLQFRTYVVLISLLQTFAIAYRANADFSAGLKPWTRAPFTSRDLKAISVIAPELDADEIRRRLRASLYPGYLPNIHPELAGKLSLETLPEKPLSERLFDPRA